MPLPKNEITDSYLKFAELLVTAETDKDMNARLYKKEFDEYGNVYDLKLKSEYDYEYNIVEYAHPEPVVVALSGDRINGLVPNINEKHNIIINRINRFPSLFSFLPLIETRKTAGELANQLIRIGNDMDLEDEEELRILADECLADMVKEAAWYDDISDWAHQAVNSIGGSKADKAVNDVGGVGEGALAGAAAGAVIGGIITSWAGPVALAGAGTGALIGAVAGGLMAAVGNTSPKVKNIRENAKDLLDQMEDLKKAVPEEASFFIEVESVMAKLTDSSSKYLSAMDKARSITSTETGSLSDATAISDATKNFQISMGMVAKLRNEFNQKNQIGAFANAKSSIPHFGLVADDIEDVEQSFQSLQVAIDDLNKQMTRLATKAADKVQEVKTEDNKPAVDSAKEDSYMNFGKALNDSSEAAKAFQNQF